MNYYNPYFYSMPTTLNTPKVGLLTKLFGKTGITIGNFLNGTQRVLNFANQAIPLVKQVRPMIGNAKTMFKVMNEFKRAEPPKQTIGNQETQNIIETEKEIVNENIVQTIPETYDNGPTFFM